MYLRNTANTKEYGSLANTYCRYFDIRNAEAITASGQLAIKWAAKHINVFLNNIMKTTDVDYVIAIDTDSLYLNLESLVEKYVPSNKKTTTEIVDILDGWAKGVLQPQIDKLYDNLAAYINSYKQKMVMAREVIADTGFWTGKKRYALNVHDSEGVRYKEPKVKIMGIECVKASIPEFCRNGIKTSIKKILALDEASVQEYIETAKEEFFEQPVEELSYPRGVNNIEKWTSPDGTPKKGCPIHVRGAIVYNKYLDDNGYTDERIQSGDKIKYAYLKMPNVFNSNVISFPPMMNGDVYEKLKKYIDTEKQWKGTFFDPTDSIMKIVGWDIVKVNKILEICEDGEEY